MQNEMVYAFAYYPSDDSNDNYSKLLLYIQESLRLGTLIIPY